MIRLIDISIKRVKLGKSDGGGARSICACANEKKVISLVGSNASEKRRRARRTIARAARLHSLAHATRATSTTPSERTQLEPRTGTQTCNYTHTEQRKYLLMGEWDAADGPL